MKNYLLIIIILACFVSFGLAEEYLCQPETDMLPANGPAMLDSYGEASLQPATIPVWHVLEMMSQSERLNSNIEIVLEANASNQARSMAANIERLWNGGQFEEALSLFNQLAQLTDVNEMGIGNAWRTPVPTQEISTWGNDVRIGNRDSIMVPAFDIHRATGNLFAALLLLGDNAAGHWTVNFSGNGGLTWAETYDFTGVQPVSSIDGVVVASHFYVAYNFGANLEGAFIRQFRATDGQYEIFSDGSLFKEIFSVSSPDSIKEVAITSNHDFWDNRLYYMAITAQRSLRFYWDDPGCLSWIQISTGVTNAERGLDNTCNEGYDTHFTWASYFNTGDTLKVLSLNTNDVWSQRYSYFVGSGSPRYTALGAYHDTVFVLYEFHRNNFYCRYNISYNAGSSWSYGIVDDTTVTHESPGIAMRDGGGIAIAYRFYTPTRQGRFNSRTYAFEPWGPYVYFTDIEPFYNRPSIENLGNGNFGIIYLSWRTPPRAAYFDCGEFQTSIEPIEENLPATFQVLQNYPNPFNAETNISYGLSEPAKVTVEVFDILGRHLATLVDEEQAAGYHQVTWDASNVSSGTYFYKIKAGDQTETRKMTLIK